MSSRRSQQRQDNVHLSQLQGQEDRQGETAEILRALSEVQDLPINPQDDPIMGQLISTLTSTANLSEEQVRSNEWFREIIWLLYSSLRPTPEGMHGAWRGYAKGDASEALAPLSPQERVQGEAAVGMSKLALSRSEDAKVVEEATRTVKQSIVSDDEGGGSSGGVLSRLTGGN